MRIKPKQDVKKRLDYFEDQGLEAKKLKLISAVYFDRSEEAEKIIREDPEQINQQDPYAGLTALHIAIFRQNQKLVGLIATHPQCDLHIQDNFYRKAVDMLDYTINQAIFETVIDASYPDEMHALEDEAFEEGVVGGDVVPFRPKEL